MRKQAQRSLINSVTRMMPCNQNMTSSKGVSMVDCLNTRLDFINPFWLGITWVPELRYRSSRAWLREPG